PQDASLKMRLSEYGFFQGKVAEHIPAKGVLPYQLNTPLFSDYAEKLRFVQLPDGATVPYNDQEVLDFPVGTTIIKTFYYPVDARKPAKGRQLLETRLLIHHEEGWEALAYHWDDEQTDAYLEVAGGKKKVAWINEAGKKQKLEYSMPNVNQCKGCHSYEGAMRPIGPSVRQLNGDFPYETGKMNQLDKWEEVAWLAGLAAKEDRPQIAVWNDPNSGSLDARARAWLDINCAHCHNPKGPASTSGFFLDIHQEDPAVYGVLKTPVAAGRGSGEREYDIQPGDANESILFYRIDSDDPGIMMPELGRKLIHKEGVDLIRDWINAME
ncbi:MAG: SO2930 family diheme c-type cytochrome, partial [Bacteroidota bacterium]